MCAHARTCPQCVNAFKIWDSWGQLLGFDPTAFKLCSLSLQGWDSDAIDLIGLLWRLNYMVLLLFIIVIDLFSDAFFFQFPLKHEHFPMAFFFESIYFFKWLHNISSYRLLVTVVFFSFVILKFK